MFLYFIQKKRWLGNDTHFIKSLWDTYKRSKQSDRFFNDWLSVLFFDAFNKRYQNRSEYLKRFPQEIHNAFTQAPFLNGGLFSENELDNVRTSIIPDSLFVELFDRFSNTSPGFLERYNFTVNEDTPLDQEVAVDPEMIGKVYESLVNITFEGKAETDQRGEAGIFYTPRVEIDLMCRLSVTDWLTNHLGNEYKVLIRRAVFAYSPEEKQAADNALLNANLIRQIYDLLVKITVLDPACGSGSFLVGMLLVLDDLLSRFCKILGVEETSYERRKRIIGQSLYGVDVMDWAVHVAELRLWLQLVVDTKLEPAELQFRPLLPNLSFKVRCGDSLVQQIAGVNFGVHRHHLELPASVKGKLTALKGEKLNYFQGNIKDSAATRARIERDEIHLFSLILHEKKITLDKKIIRLKEKIENPDEAEQLELLNTGKRKAPQLKLESVTWERQLAELEYEYNQLAIALQALAKTNEVPFVWDVAFVEIFEGDSTGFDIVVGNPPYVRQEKIADPHLDSSEFGGENNERWKKKKSEYKAALQNSVYEAYDKFFGFNSTKGTVAKKLNGKCDLYVYFFFHGLSLLNENGSFCFITSNSWLDVGYGADLQEFLLKQCRIKLVLDNEAKRSFKQADVNTVICLFSAPNVGRDGVLTKGRLSDSSYNARFAMFKVPFEYALSPVVFEEIEEATDRFRRPEFRVVVKNQHDLFEEGLESSDDEEPQRTTLHERTYAGDKWGGKYLRAPDIFYTILEKGKDKLIRLGEIAEVRFGIKTGANEFFYLDNEKIAEWQIEKEFLKPVIKSPKDCPSIEITDEHLHLNMLWIDNDNKKNRSKNVLKYIEWGEKQKFNVRPSLSLKDRWFVISEKVSKILWWKSIGERYACFWNPDLFPTEQRNYFIYTERNIEMLLTCVLNSTIDRLFIETSAREMTGAYTIIELSVEQVRRKTTFDPRVLASKEMERLLEIFSQLMKRKLLGIFNECGFDGKNPIRSQHPNPLPDRKALDDIIFDAIGLTKAERNEVYYAVCELVQNRLNKAKSV